MHSQRPSHCFLDRKFFLYGKYFCSSDGKGERYLHRAVWVAHNGPIPDGWHVHHKDGDSLNNDISNLEAIDGCEHVRQHGLAAPHLKSKERMELLNRIRPNSRKWLKDPKRREELSRTVIDAWNSKEKLNLSCQHCGGVFHSPQPKRRYCSYDCKQAAKNIARRKAA